MSRASAEATPIAPTTKAVSRQDTKVSMIESAGRKGHLADIAGEIVGAERRAEVARKAEATRSAADRMLRAGAQAAQHQADDQQRRCRRSRPRSCSRGRRARFRLPAAAPG